MRLATRLLRLRTGEKILTNNKLTTKHSESLMISEQSGIEYVIYDCGSESCGPTHIYRNGRIIQ